MIAAIAAAVSAASTFRLPSSRPDVSGETAVGEGGVGIAAGG
jgi:hypothetical protein